MMVCDKCGCTYFQVMEWHEYLKCFECANLIDLIPSMTNRYNERPIEPKKAPVPRSYTEVWVNENIAIIREFREDGMTWETINYRVAKLSGIKTKRHIVSKYAQVAGVE